MAQFIYKENVCKLQFGNNEFELPLNEQTADEISKAFGDNVLPAKFESIADLDTFYNNAMDSIDRVLGEGAAEAIMSGYKHAGALEIMGVINFISTQWSEQYKAVFEEMKQTAHLPNRETRRANKGGRR